MLVWALLLRPQTLAGPASYVVVAGHSMNPALRSGDLVIARERDTYATGDVVIYPIPDGQGGAGVRVIHRIVGGTAGAGYVTQGDNRDTADVWRPTPGQIDGKQWLRIPSAGHPLALLNSPILPAIAGAIATFLAITAPRRRS